MSHVVKLANPEDLARRYNSGTSLKELSRETGVCEPVLRNHLLLHGAVLRVPKRGGRAPLKLERSDELVSRYLAGETAHALSREWGVSREAINTHLANRGIAVRGVSAANTLRMSALTPEDRSALTAAAHTAARGRTVSTSQLARQAATKERRVDSRSHYELQLTAWLVERGLAVTRQKADGPYNIDIAVSEPLIAVEVYGGNWHSHGAHLRRHTQRCHHLLNQGWALVIVWVKTKEIPFGVGTAEYIVALADELRRHPAPSRQYLVIRGDGTPAPVSQNNLNTRAIIETLGCAGQPSR